MATYFTSQDYNEYGGSCTSSWHVPNEAEITAGWVDTIGQGNKEARKRGRHCVVVRCDREAAIVMSRMFHKKFAMESACHFDGTTLSMFCGHSGGNGMHLMYHVLQDIVRPYEFASRQAWRGA